MNGRLRHAALTALALALAAPVAAQDTLAAGIGGRLEDLRDRPGCAPHQNAYRYALIGVPRGDPRLSVAERDRVNDLLAAAMRAQSMRLDPAVAENASVIAGLQDTIGLSEEGLRTSLGRLGADFVLLARAQRRPSAGEVVLRLSVLTPPAEGRPGCDDVLTLALDLGAGGAAMEADLGPADLHDLDAVLTGFVARNAARFAAAPAVAVEGHADMPEGCETRTRLTRALRRAHFAARPGDVGADWPGLDDAAQMRLVARLAPLGDADATLDLALMDGGAQIDAEIRDVLLRTRLRAGCPEPGAPREADVTPVADVQTDPETEAEAPEIAAAPETPPEESAVATPPPRETLTIVPNRPAYLLGDTIELTITASTGCDLSLINVRPDGSSCLFVPHPQLSAIRLEANAPYVFPPRGRMVAVEPVGAARFVGLCNATDAELAQALGAQADMECVAKPEVRRELESGFLDLGADASATLVRGELDYEVAR